MAQHSESPEVWGGVEHSVVRIGDAYRCSTRRSRHDARPDDIARVVAFLVSEDGGWVTGQRIDASGGQRL